MQNPIPTDERFAIKTSVFEGPLELLLDLVERRKLLINDISLASVTDEFIQHVTHMQKDALQQTSHFIVVAATLLLIKSKSLLPVLELTDEEEHSIEELEKRLRLYQTYRDVAQMVQQMYGRRKMYSKRFAPKSLGVFMPDRYTTHESVVTSIFDVLHNLPKPKQITKAHLVSIISLEEMIARLRARVEEQIRCTFSELTENEIERKNVIVCFLAILEMYKQGNVIIAQIRHFDDIELEKGTLSIPKYT